jgi:adenosine deaminase
MTISSDDPPFMNTRLTDELRQFVRIAGLTRDDLAELQRRGARNSFAAPVSGSRTRWTQRSSQPTVRRSSKSRLAGYAERNPLMLA